MDMSSNSQLVIFDRLFVMVAEFERSYIELNFLHVTIKAGEGGGQPFRDLSLLFMSLFQGGGEGVGQLWTMSLILVFFKSLLRKLENLGQDPKIKWKIPFLTLPNNKATLRVLSRA